MLFFAGFAAMLLNGVLFLTTIWHESVLSAGLMLFPGPFMAAAFSVPSARLAARVGYRVPGIAGASLFLVGSLWWITQTHGAPAYVYQYLPAMAISGAGVGLVLPTLTGAGAASLPPERFATGAAVLTMGRQVGSALGIALLVAVLGAGSATLADFHAAWLISALGAVSTAWPSQRWDRLALAPPRLSRRPPRPDGARRRLWRPLVRPASSASVPSLVRYMPRRASSL